MTSPGVCVELINARWDSCLHPVQGRPTCPLWLRTPHRPHPCPEGLLEAPWLPWAPFTTPSVPPARLDPPRVKPRSLNMAEPPRPGQPPPRLLAGRTVGLGTLDPQGRVLCGPGAVACPLGASGSHSGLDAGLHYGQGSGPPTVTQHSAREGGRWWGESELLQHRPASPCPLATRAPRVLFPWAPECLRRGRRPSAPRAGERWFEPLAMPSLPPSRSKMETATTRGTGGGLAGTCSLSP